MPLKNYGVLACRVLDTRAEGGAGAPHFQIRVRGGERDFRVAVNVLSQEAPSELLYAADEAFEHPVLTALPGLPDGFSVLPNTVASLPEDLRQLIEHTEASVGSVLAVGRR